MLDLAFFYALIGSVPEAMFKLLYFNYNGLTRPDICILSITAIKLVGKTHFTQPKVKQKATRDAQNEEKSTRIERFRLPNAI